VALLEVAKSYLNRVEQLQSGANRFRVALSLFEMLGQLLHDMASVLDDIGGISQFCQ
jgi:hypothetical protein